MVDVTYGLTAVAPAAPAARPAALASAEPAEFVLPEEQVVGARPTAQSWSGVHVYQPKLSVKLIKMVKREAGVGLQPRIGEGMGTGAVDVGEVDRLRRR
jgi:hypothetical protein